MPLQSYVFLSLILLFLPTLLVPATVATGHFEVYCDGIGVFLANVDGTPAPGKLVLFSYMSFPPGTIGGYLGQGKWSNVHVYSDGCVPDGKCEPIAHGEVWIDAWDTSDTGNAPPKRVSGKYEIDLNGKHLEGPFLAKEHTSKHPLRLCM
jgi:hypothetical protein